MTQATFKFISDAAGGDHFTVVGFCAHEGISTLYRYEIELKAPVMEEIDLDDVLDAPARFVTELGGVEYPVHGVLCTFEETRFVQNYSYYRAVLVPRIWKLTNYKTNEIFYQAGDGTDEGKGQTVAEIIQQVLEKAGMVNEEFDLAGLNGNLLQREYRCQYNESDFDFLSRLMENEGIFYYFEQGTAEETIVLVNDMNYVEIPRPKLLFDVAAQAKNQDDCVYALSCRKQRLPEQVIVRDYNPDEPSLDVSDVTPVDSMGQGIDYIYGKNVHSDKEATYLSQIRAEEHMCRKTQFFGESSVTRLQSGHLFALDGHPNEAYNGVEYLAVEVEHEGSGLDLALGDSSKGDAQPQYRNSFVAIPAEVQYRPPRRTSKPRITGTLHAVIDGENASDYAQLDDQGRYKVKLPFDFHNENHPEGLASARVRMMQPYAGKHMGMQFPLLKGTEVLLSFVDGDPDRPIIAGAINSNAAPGPVSADNQSESVIQTGGNNKIRIEDEFDSERIIMETPASNSWIRIGTPNDPLPNPIDLDGDGDNEIEFAANGVRVKTDGSVWTEALDHYGEFIAGAPTNSAKNAALGDYPGSGPTKVTTRDEMLAMFKSTGQGGTANYRPKGLKARFGGATEDLDIALEKSHVRVSSLDTFTTQEGNIYDFGGYWNYNLGNSYAENHIDQKPRLNDQLDVAFPMGEGSVPANLGTWLGATVVPGFMGIAASNSMSTGGAIAGGFAAGSVGFLATLIATQMSSDQKNKRPNLARGTGDVVTTGGPGSKPITTWAEKVGSSFEGTEQTEESLARKYDETSFERQPDAPDDKKVDRAPAMNQDTAWVEKNFGDSYSFTQGNSIEITNGHSEEHVRGDVYEFKYGGIREETSFNGKGVKTHWAKSEKGKSWECNWSPVSGFLESYEFKDHGHFTFSVTLPSYPRLVVDFSMATMDTSFKASAGTSFDISLAAAMAVDIDLTAGIKMKYEKETGGKIEFNETEKKFVFKTFGMILADEKAEIKNKNMELQKLVTAIVSGDLKVEDGKLKVSKNGSWVDTSVFKFF